MRGLARKLKNWWQGQPSTAGAPPPFEVTCACGQKLKGIRQMTHQVAVCPRCAAERFILPRSPFPPPLGRSSAPSLSERSSLTPYLFPLAAAAVTVLVLVILFVHYLTPEQQPAAAPKDSELAGRLAQAHQLMRAGNFRLAAEAFTALAPALEELSATERRGWSQLSREALLLADLSSEGLEDILLQAARTGEAEWRADFRHRYYGRSILFDAMVQRQGKSYRMNYSLAVDGEEAHVELGDVVLFKKLELEQPRRLIFGVRLASVGREAPGPRWVVRFLPESGVLLTDGAAAAWVCPAWRDAVEEQEKNVEVRE